MTDGDDADPSKRLDTVCRYWEEVSCAWKEKYICSQFLRNQYSKNKGQQYNDKFELVLCTVKDFEGGIIFNDDDLAIDYLTNDSNTLDKSFTFMKMILIVISCITCLHKIAESKHTKTQWKYMS